MTFEGIKNYDGLHAPLIDIETFERVQEVLRGHALSGDRTHKHEQYLKGSVFCGQCEGRLIFTPVRGNGGRYEYFRCFGRHNLRNGCDAPHVAVDTVETAVERYYGRHQWLTEEEKTRVRAAVRGYADSKLRTAQRESERAQRRLEALKQEQQRLLQLSYRDLVDDEVLAAEQVRIRSERAQVAKWAKTANLDAEDITRALEEALQLLEDPGTAYLLATPVTRRMFNQALFERLLVLDEEVIEAAPAPWIRALEDVARGTQEPPQRQTETPQWTLEQGLSGAASARTRRRARNNHGPGNRGHGLNFDQVVRRRGLEPPRGNSPTRPSTLRVYQFRHRRRAKPSIGRDSRRLTSVRPPL